MSILNQSQTHLCDYIFSCLFSQYLFHKFMNLCLVNNIHSHLQAINCVFTFSQSKTVASHDTGNNQSVIATSSKQIYFPASINTTSIEVKHFLLMYATSVHPENMRCMLRAEHSIVNNFLLTIVKNTSFVFLIADRYTIFALQNTLISSS